MSTKKAKPVVEEIESQQAEEKPPDMAFFLPNDEQQSVYRFILASAKRARQLQGEID